MKGLTLYDLAVEALSDYYDGVPVIFFVAGFS